MTQTLGEKLKARRKELGLTLEQAATEAGTFKGHLHSIENPGCQRPGFHLICRLARVYKIPLAELDEGM